MKFLFSDINANDLKIKAGTSTPGATGALDSGTRIDVVRIVSHPDFDITIVDYDFSLLELAENFTFDSTMQPIGIPEQNQEYPDNTHALVTGWGNTQNADESTDHLRAVSLPLVNQEVCNEAYSAYFGVTDSMICAGYLREGGKSACTGKIITYSEQRRSE